MRKVLSTALAVFALLGTTCWAQVTQLVSLDSSGVQSNDRSFAPSVSSDGRFVVFHSDASNLVPLDTNGAGDIFLRDRWSGTTERVNVASNGTEANNVSGFGSALSSNSRYAVFPSLATNLVPGDTNGKWDIFVRDRQQGTTERVSVDAGEAQGNDESFGFAISANGRFVAFMSYSTNLVAGDTNGYPDIFLRDRQLGTTELVSVASNGIQGNFYSDAPSISGEGRYVSFYSHSTNLVPGDTNTFPDVFVRDRQSSTTERVSIASNGAEGDMYSTGSCLSEDGRFVAFHSESSTLVPGDTNNCADAFLRDRQNGTTVRISLDSNGNEGDDTSYLGGITPDGGTVVFASVASNLVAGDTNLCPDVFLRDLQLGTTVRVSVAWDGGQSPLRSWGGSISADGRYVAFESEAMSLVPGDGNGYQDIFVRDVQGGTNFSTSCSPGLAGVLPCPCANPPSGPGRGCNNSSATGGAILSASGGTFLSSDSLVFTTSGEKPTALSLLAQWIGADASGMPFGQGVRCTSGTFKRLFSKNAVAGSVTLPNFGAGDPSVSARSAAKGDTILAAQSRWYVVYYRDNSVLGGCPATSNFNATQTGQVTWSP